MLQSSVTSPEMMSKLPSNDDRGSHTDSCLPRPAIAERRLKSRRYPGPRGDRPSDTSELPNHI